MRLILYIAMVWLAVSIPLGLLIGRLCAQQDHQEQWPGEASDVEAPSAESDSVPVYANLTRSASL